MTRRLRAPGVKVPTVNDGEAVLRFPLLSLSMLEDEWGTIAKAWEALRESAKEGIEVPSVGPVGSFLAAGLSSEDAVLSAAEALALVDCSLADAREACFDAIEQAFPDSGKAEADGTPSTGTGSTGSSPSATTAPTPSSGP